MATAKITGDDLKQFVLSMVSNHHGIPLFTQPYSGNESDKKILLETILKVKQNLNLQDRAYYIADSAFYTEKNLQTLGQHTFWISHVPATLSPTKSLLATEIPMVPGQDPGYSFYECLMDYGGMPQKWVLVSSEKGRKRQEKTFERNLKKRIELARKSLKKNSKQRGLPVNRRLAGRLNAGLRTTRFCVLTAS
jgi:transposase